MTKQPGAALPPEAALVQQEQVRVATPINPNTCQMLRQIRLGVNFMEVPNADFQIIHALHARVNGENRKRSTQRPSRDICQVAKIGNNAGCPKLPMTAQSPSVLP